MAEVAISGLIDGGKASGGPPFGPALGPLGVDINKIIAEINERTKHFSGVKVPVKVLVDTGTKAFRVEVGEPPTSALILKELGKESGAKTKDEVIGSITMEQLKKVAKAKEAKLYGRSEKERIKQLLGTCKSMGVKFEDEDPVVAIKKISSGELKV